jgi:hypothetical protein
VGPPERNVIGILTSDVRLFYDLARFLSARKLAFRMIDFETGYPRDIGVILTSPAELDSVNFEPRIAVTDIEAAVRQARMALNGVGEEHELVMGVDPGPEPGIAAILGGRVIETRVANSPEQAAVIILGILEDYSFSRCILRIGHGSKAHRDRVLELVGAMFDEVEIVDETCTSNTNRGHHEEAAVRIARCVNL